MLIDANMVMKDAGNSILIINSGSSSIKFAVYEAGGALQQTLEGEISGVGKETAVLLYRARHREEQEIALKESNPEKTFLFLLHWLENQTVFESIRAVGHRIVHGMQHSQPEIITPSLIRELKAISNFDPDHLPSELQLIELFAKKYPLLQQVACFDTAFHYSMPEIAKLLPIPLGYRQKGLQRYGFHGLSYHYLVTELEQIAGSAVAHGKIIIAHLGSGASLCAIKDGKSIDTSMGFTPVSGIPMSTRTGDLDPGVAWWLMQEEKMSADDFNKLINHEGGLKGISGVSGDMKELLMLQKQEPDAAIAVSYFCYQVKKWIGAFAAVMGGMDTLVFSGGIGEQSAEIRSHICEEMEFLGITLDETPNQTNAPIISRIGGRVAVRVMKTNEAMMMATLVSQRLKLQ